MSRLHAAGLVFFWLVLLAAPREAAADDHYGAIAFSQSSGNWGYSFDFASRGGAERDALNRCGDGCQIVLWFRNACGALASGDDNSYGTGWASSRGEAERIAMSGCRENSSKCSVTAWVCTTR
jgi:Domain of unknown function (DUF4189)